MPLTPSASSRSCAAAIADDATGHGWYVARGSEAECNALARTDPGSRFERSPPY